jgi:hypothetical protein
VENLEFLSDVVPKTTTYKQIKQRKEASAKAAPPPVNGQKTLDLQMGNDAAQASNGAIDHDTMDVDGAEESAAS